MLELRDAGRGDETGDAEDEGRHFRLASEEGPRRMLERETHKMGREVGVEAASVSGRRTRTSLYTYKSTRISAEATSTIPALTQSMRGSSLPTPSPRPMARLMRLPAP